MKYLLEAVEMALPLFLFICGLLLLAVAFFAAVDRHWLAAFWLALGALALIVGAIAWVLYQEEM